MLKTGENEHGLKMVIDMIRMLSIVILSIHLYYNCYAAFTLWHLTAPLVDHLLINIGHTGLLLNFVNAKLISFGLLLLSLLGVAGKKSEKITYGIALTYFFLGIALYYGSVLILMLHADNIPLVAGLYIGLTGSGYIGIMTGGGMLSRIIRHQLKPDIFNKSNETFPQEDRVIENEFSLKFRTQYIFKGKIRDSFLCIPNPARGILLAGNPGSGKSFYIVEPAIRQFIEKKHALFVYDVKYPELTEITYNHYLQHRKKYPVQPTFHVINFDDLSRSARCNPLDPDNMDDITDAAEAARVIMLGLNPSWITRQGDFFVDSPINFVTAIIWFLRRYQDGEYCTLPHVIEMMNVELAQLLTILQTEPEISSYVSPFIDAYKDNNTEMLGGQIASAKIGMARLSSPALYYVLSGNDLSLDINNPKAPKIVCLANNLRKQEVYGPILSLFLTRMAKIINQKDKYKCAVVADEFATLRWLNYATLISTGRSNKISVLVAIQSDHQLKLNYGKDWADIVTSICGNIILGQVSGDIAKLVSEQLGKTLQDRENLSINSSDTSISRSKQLEFVVPVSTIANLSSGEFVGRIADNPDQPVELKTFHRKIINDIAAINQAKANFLPLPVVQEVTKERVQENYRLIKQEVQDIVDLLMERVLNTDSLKGLFVKKAE